MPIRARLKKVISRRRSSTSSPSSSTSSSSTNSSNSDRSSSIYYQPGEKIPYKYRRPVEPAHQEKLDSFSFGDAWRSKSVASQYSPMGSRMPSRQNSLVKKALSGAGRGLSFSKKRAGSTSTQADNDDIDDDEDNGRPSRAGKEQSCSACGGAMQQLTPIESVPITRMEPADIVATMPEPFSQSELDKALGKVSIAAN